MFEAFIKTITHWLTQIGFSPEAASKIAGISDFVMVLLLGGIIYYISKFIILKIIKRIALRTASSRTKRKTNS
jgi:hypothetical protein